MTVIVITVMMMTTARTQEGDGGAENYNFSKQNSMFNKSVGPVEEWSTKDLQRGDNKTRLW